MISLIQKDNIANAKFSYSIILKERFLYWFIFIWVSSYEDGM